MGLLVDEFPVVLGVDASGVVVEAGSEAESKYNLRPGIYVCGCTRLGLKPYAAGQEYFLMDAQVTIPKPQNIDIVQAATLGVGIETASIAVFDGLKVEVPNPDQLPEQRDEWVIVLGGASSVGGFAIQLLRAAGYKVLASCSSKSASAVKGFGAEVFDYKKSIQEQVDAVLQITGGNFSRIFDAVASDDPVIAKELFKQDALSSKTKLFASTNDWSGIGHFEGGNTYEVKLGPIGRPEAAELNNNMEKWIPVLVKLVENGHVKVGDYEMVGSAGAEGVVAGYKYKSGGTSGLKKIVVKIQDE